MQRNTTLHHGQTSDSSHRCDTQPQLTPRSYFTEILESDNNGRSTSTAALKHPPDRTYVHRNLADLQVSHRSQQNKNMQRSSRLLKGKDFWFHPADAHLNSMLVCSALQARHPKLFESKHDKQEDILPARQNSERVLGVDTVSRVQH